MAFKWDDILGFLWTHSRFTSYFYQSVRFAEDHKLPTLTLTVWSYKAVLFYNPAFVETLSEDELVGLLVHEMLHVIFSHDHRALKNENPHLQNMAQDMVINSYIKDNARTFFSKKIRRDRDVMVLRLPPGLPEIPDAFYSETGVKDPSWEAVYQWLKTRSPDILKEFTEGLRENFRAPGAKTKTSPDADKKEAPMADEIMPETKDDAYNGDVYIFRDTRGDILPAGVHPVNDGADKQYLENNLKTISALAKKDETAANERFFMEISSIIEKAQKIEKKGFIKQIRTITAMLNTSSDWEYSYGRFNKRYFNEGIYSAGRRLKHEQILTVAVDVSASMVMRPDTIETAFGAVEALLQDYIVHLVCIDETVFVPEKKEGVFIAGSRKQGPYIYKKGDWKYIRSGNSGTTFFAPLFNDYMKKHKEMLIVITDGEIYDTGALNRYPSTLWLIPEGGGKDGFTPPFGKAVEIRPQSGQG